MTTSTPTTPAPESKPKHSLLDAMKRGREYAASLVMLVTLGHSLYASYFKEEKVAKTNYEATSETLTSYSHEVKDQLEALKFRTTVLEAELAARKIEVKPEVKPAPAPRPKIVIIEEPDQPAAHSIPIEYQDIIERQPQTSMASDGDGIIDDPLIINLPERPWEQQPQVKK